MRHASHELSVGFSLDRNIFSVSFSHCLALNHLKVLFMVWSGTLSTLYNNNILTVCTHGRMIMTYMYNRI